MFDLVKQLISMRHFSLEDGKIHIFQQPVVIEDLEAVLFLQEDLMKRGLENAIYHACKKSGYDWFKNMCEEYKVGVEESVRKWGPDMMRVAGWGAPVVLKFDPEKSLIHYRIDKSIVAQRFKDAGVPVCHSVRGYGTGMSEYLFGRKMDGVEIKCRAAGDSNCEMLLKPSDEFDFEDSEVRRQLGEG